MIDKTRYYQVPAFPITLTPLDGYHLRPKIKHF